MRLTRAGRRHHYPAAPPRLLRQGRPPRRSRHHRRQAPRGRDRDRHRPLPGRHGALRQLHGTPRARRRRRIRGALSAGVPGAFGPGRLISDRRGACPPARRPRRELRSARRLEARPGLAGLAAASHRAVLGVHVLGLALPPPAGTAALSSGALHTGGVAAASHRAELSAAGWSTQARPCLSLGAPRAPGA